MSKPHQKFDLTYMMNRSTLFLITLFVLGFAVSRAGAQTAQIRFEKNTVERGSTVRGVVVLDLPEGLHVNSNRPESEYLIPTTVVVNASGIRAGKIRYPKGRDRTFKFSSDALNVYEGRVEFPFTLTIPKQLRNRTIQVSAKVDFQACTDEVCYLPDSRTAGSSIRIR